MRASVQYILREAKVVITCRGLNPSATETLNDNMLKVKSVLSKMKIMSTCKNGEY